ncbi:long-chain-fatty-acid--CoA ligase [Paenibacillus larvae]|uniref:long-chain-fatty-acid--CoA ligase n=1 Tax=Paenibacillus larvae TaxID=1464 RepID=UPI0023A9CC43|nr:long-chain fatty acid--CoA ligase [Paenibacillus larvae]MDE5135731.1 long-chain fatty acid--CoA ligase [Paenibacillus larvae subsp. larvae]
MNTERPWHSHYPSETATTYEYPKHNLAKLLMSSAEEFPKKDALYFMGKKMTYEELLEECYRFANGLIGLGIRKGERIAIMLPNSPQSIIAYYGALLIGAIVVQTNPLYMERELEHQLVDSGSVAIVVLDMVLERVQNVWPKTKLKHVIVTGVKDYLPFPKNLLFTLKAKKEGTLAKVPQGEGIFSFKELIAASPNIAVYEEVDAENDLALLQYTGGTTGLSKGVMLTHYNLLANAVQINNWFYRAVPGEEVFLAALPFFHVFGMTVLMNQSVSIAGKLVIVPKFDVDLVLKTITKMRPTLFPGAPTMYISLINHAKIEDYDLSSINVCVSGSAALPLEVQERFEQLSGGRLIEGYGLTESSPVAHVNPIWEKRKLGSIGIPVPDTDAKIVDPVTAEELPVGEIGELIIKGPQVMKGYWNRDEETRQTLRDGWLFTGDMGTMDEDGYFFIVDRKKDMIIASGFNIYPREIEEVLYEHPHVKEAIVAGVPDPYRGETVKAFIVPREGAPISKEELNKWCRERLAAYKVPRMYEFRDSLPKTLVGKVLRRRLLEEEMENQKMG